jgi:chemotaxis protein MotB
MFDKSDPLEENSPQDELWLISYADMLTLLIGFFVLIIASVPLRRASFERIAAALSGSHRAAPLEELREKVDRLVERSPELKDRVRTRDDAEGLGIEFKDALLFDSGSAAVRPEALPAIDEIARLLRELPARPVTIEGHTDDVPISTRDFQSNWELSSQRAINVLNALQAAGMERERMSARAWAETRPLETQGNLEQRRSANRRVVIRVE